MRYLFFVTVFCFSTVSFSQNTLFFDDHESSYRSGLDLLDKSHYTAARQEFEEYLQYSHDPVRKADAEYYIAFCALALYHQDGEKRIENFIKNHPDHPKSGIAYYELGNFYFKEKKYKRTVKYLEMVDLVKVTEEVREDTRYKLGYSYFAQRQFDNAIEYFNILKNKKGAYSAASSYYAGFIEYERKEYDKAIIDLERAAKDESYANVAPELLANLYYKQKRYDDLITFGERIINSDAGNKSRLALLLGDAHLYKNQLNKAANYYQAYESNTSKISREVRYRIGYTYYNQGEYNKAINQLKRTASDKDSIGIYASYYLGVMYLKDGNKLYAKTAFLNARENTINASLREEGAYQFGKVSYDLDKSSEALEALNYYLTTYPSGKHVDEIGDLLSEGYLKTNNYELALKYIEKRGVTRNLQPVYQKATYLKGAELFNNGDYRNSIAYFDKSLKYPVDEQFVSMSNLWAAEAYSVGRKYEQALPYYQRILGRGNQVDKQTIMRARYGTAYAYYNTKQYDKALIHFKEIIQNGNDGANMQYYNDAEVRLADCYYVKKEYTTAISYYNKSSKKRHADKDYALYQLGLINGIQGNVNAAVKAFDDVIGISRSRFVDDAMFQKGQVHFEKGLYDEAIMDFGQLISSKPSSRFVPYALLRRGSAAYNLQKYDQTIADYTTIINKYTTSKVASEVLLPLQEVLNLTNRGGEFDNYLTVFKQANPDKSGLDVVEFEAAKNAYFNLDYRNAIKKLDQFLNDYPDNPNAIEAKYYQAESYYRLREYDPALELYNELFGVVEFNQHSRVIGRIAEIEYSSGRYENAIYFYRELEVVASNRKQQYNVWDGLMESFFLLAQYDSSQRYAKIILDDGNVHISSKNKALLYLGKSAFAKGDYDQAQDEFLATLNTAKDQFGAEAQYMLGQIYYLTGDYNKSIETLISLNNDFNAYNEWVGKAFLLLADNYLALDDTFQAIGTLKSIVDDFPEEYYRQKAQEKIEEIELLEQVEEETGQNEIDSLINDN